MNLKARIAKLEKLTEDRAVKIGLGLGTGVLVRERQALCQWLERQGLAVEEAIAGGLTGPPELQYVTLQSLHAAKERVAAWHARFGAENGLLVQKEGAGPARRK
jgi:hypothetical protein